jgi:hypothetical protein
MPRAQALASHILECLDTVAIKSEAGMMRHLEAMQMARELANGEQMLMEMDRFERLVALEGEGDGEGVNGE